jgi:hypothetical protein
MNKLKLYLDTSVINFIFADDAPEKKEITIDFFDNFIKTGIYDAFISEFVIAEILDTPDNEKRESLLKVIQDYRLSLIELRDKSIIQNLARKYIDKEIVPIKKIADSFHIAISVLYDVDFLVSWNYKHMANVKKENEVREISIINNLNSKLRIITPTELIYDKG